MDQEKIGKFIAKLRKEKNMTQVDLAKKLGITDRAISKWENGRGMPDLSLMKSLCNELDITINELLSGEKINKENYEKKFEENIVNTIDYTNKKIKNNIKIFKIIFGIIICLIIFFITIFCIDVDRMRNKKEVLFSTWGFDYYPAVDLKDEKIEIAIKEYLIEEKEEIKYDNEKSFVSMKVFLIEEKRSKKIYNVYAWVLQKNYYLENGEIIEISGSSIPHKFVVELINDEYVVTESKIPRDGSLYVDDMKNIFPISVRREINLVHNDGTIERLELDIEEQVKLYFNK